MAVTYINDPDYFDILWSMISSYPNHCCFTDEMRALLPDEMVTQLGPDSYYLLVSKNNNIRVISFDMNSIAKHAIGQNPAAWSHTKVGPIKESPGRGPVYVILDLDLLDMGILNIVKYQGFASKVTQVHAEGYRMIIRNRYHQELKLGDMVHIPVYDTYSVNHCDIYYAILIYDGKELVYPEEGNDYGFLAPKETPFPIFSLEHFAPLGRSGNLVECFRWVTAGVVKQYNEAAINKYVESNQYNDDPYYIKIIVIDGRAYHLVASSETCPVELSLVRIDKLRNYLPENEEDTDDGQIDAIVFD